MGRKGQMEQSILIGLLQLRKMLYLERWTRFSETFCLHRADPFYFCPKFRETLDEWLVPVDYGYLDLKRSNFIDLLGPVYMEGGCPS